MWSRSDGPLPSFPTSRFRRGQNGGGDIPPYLGGRLECLKCTPGLLRCKLYYVYFGFPETSTLYHHYNNSLSKFYLRICESTKSDQTSTKTCTSSHEYPVSRRRVSDVEKTVATTKGEVNLLSMWWVLNDLYDPELGVDTMTESWRPPPRPVNPKTVWGPAKTAWERKSSRRKPSAYGNHIDRYVYPLR